MIEVEIKLPVRNLKKVEEDLLKMGFSEKSMIEETDRYYDNAADEIRNQGEALRIRSVKDLMTEGEKHLVTFKGQKMDAISMTRTELETSVTDGEVLEGIFGALGYHVVAPVVKKKRKMMEKGRIHACLDQVEQLGEFLELEILLSQEEERLAALSQLEEILESLGYSYCDTTTTSYLSQLQGRTD